MALSPVVPVEAEIGSPPVGLTLASDQPQARDIH